MPTIKRPPTDIMFELRISWYEEEEQNLLLPTISTKHHSEYFKAGKEVMILSVENGWECVPPSNKVIIPSYRGLLLEDTLPGQPAKVLSKASAVIDGKVYRGLSRDPETDPHIWVANKGMS